MHVCDLVCHRVATNMWYGHVVVLSMSSLSIVKWIIEWLMIFRGPPRPKTDVKKYTERGVWSMTGEACSCSPQLYTGCVASISSSILSSHMQLLNYNVEYRDGIKSEGDKIGMPCTHSTVI